MERWSAGVVKKKNLFMITVWSLLIAVPSAQGISNRAQGIRAVRIQSIRSIELKRKSFVMAENEQKATENRNQSTEESQKQAAQPAATAGENRSNNSDGAAAKPLKPFKPSEEIAAEQAVDFPVDI